MKPDTSIQSQIEKALRSHPATIGHLARKVQNDTALDEADIFENLKAMVSEKKILVASAAYEVETVIDYLFTITLSGWLWVTVIVVVASLIAVAVTPDVFPLNAIRWILGGVFVLFLPGYSLIQLLFPNASDLDSLERFALEIGISLAIVPLLGLLLNFTPWGIRLVPILASLAGFTVIASFGAGLRKYWAVRLSEH